MNARFLVRALAVLAIVPAWASTTPAYAQGRRGGGGGGGNVAGQILQSFGNRMQQPQGYHAPAPIRPPQQYQYSIGSSSMGGMQGRPLSAGPNRGPYNLVGNSSLGGMQGPRPPATAAPYLGPSNMGGFNNPSNFNSGGLANAFGGQPLYQPSPSQGYQQPQYQGYQPPYQGYQEPQYQQPTQTAAGGPVAGLAYQVPAQYANSPAGSVVSWGAYRYRIGGDGTMTWYNGPAVTESRQTASGPTPGERYQIPAEHAGTAPGSQVVYAGYTYVANNDGTMTAFNVPGQKDADVEQVATGPVPGKRYQIPTEHATAAPGSLITYGGNNYVANTDGTMTAFTAPQ